MRGRMRILTPHRKIIVQGIYIVVITFCFFLMFLGILRTFELHYKEMDTIKQYCEPKGFFGWGYDCDVIAYNKAIGNLPQDYVPPGEFVFNWSLDTSDKAFSYDIIS